MAKLLCCVSTPVRSIEGPAIAPANKALHLAVLKKNSAFYYQNKRDRPESRQSNNQPTIKSKLDNNPTQSSHWSTQNFGELEMQTRRKSLLGMPAVAP